MLCYHAVVVIINFVVIIIIIIITATLFNKHFTVTFVPNVTPAIINAVISTIEKT